MASTPAKLNHLTCLQKLLKNTQKSGLMVCIINFTFSCRECWKSHFRASKFQNFQGEHVPRPPSGHLNSYSCLLLYGQTPTSNLIESPAGPQKGGKNATFHPTPSCPFVTLPLGLKRTETTVMKATENSELSFQRPLTLKTQTSKF